MQGFLAQVKNFNTDALKVDNNSFYFGKIYYKLLTRHFMRKPYVQYCHKGKPKKMYTII